MNAIANILETTDEDYQLMVINHFALWCSTYSTSHQNLQSFVSNQKLLNWYQLQIKKLELVFYDKLSCKKRSTLEVRVLYFEVISEIAAYYPPKYLLQRLRKMNSKIIESTIYNLN
ncbi:hypothetical protein N9609_00480 [bacterium]|nr:hypothetical protein [bacterium]